MLPSARSRSICPDASAPMSSAPAWPTSPTRECVSQARLAPSAGARLAHGKGGQPRPSHDSPPSPTIGGSSEPICPRARFVAPAILTRTVAGLALIVGGLLCTPGWASTAVFPVTAALTPCAPAVVSTGSPVRADVAFGRSFSAIESACITLTYENEVLEPSEEISVGFPP
jgi:hypothetical protein